MGNVMLLYVVCVEFDGNETAQRVTKLLGAFLNNVNGSWTSVITITDEQSIQQCNHSKLNFATLKFTLDTTSITITLKQLM